MDARTKRYPGFAPGIDTIYEYEDDIIPFRILRVISERRQGADFPEDFRSP